MCLCVGLYTHVPVWAEARGIGSQGAWDRGHYEFPELGTENQNSGLLLEQYVLLTSEPSNSFEENLPSWGII